MKTLVLTQDHVEALRWFRKAADKGNAHAMYSVGVCYENGRGVSQDCATAANWYRMSAQNEFPFAGHNLGLLYYDGRGVERVLETARHWFRNAQWIERDPRRAMWIWLCSSELGEHEQAERELKGYREAHHPASVEGRILAHLAGEFSETDLIKPYESAPYPAEIIGRLFYCAGMKNLFAGNRKRAIELIEKSVKSSPKDSAICRTATRQLARMRAE